ncbi:unnamed protein product [Closterium sp. NIES-53]
MEVARTSMIHVAAPHFLWPFTVRYAAHQLNLWPRVFVPETSPTLRWTGEVGDASAFRVWGVLCLVHNTTASKLSPCTLRCTFLGFLTNAPPWQFYQPRSRRVFYSQDVTFDESFCFYRLHPHASHPVPLAPLFLVPPSLPPPQLAAVDSGATAGGDTGGAGSRGAAIGGADSGGAATRGAKTGVTASPSGGGAVGDPAGGPRIGQPQHRGLLETLSPQRIREWIIQRGRPGGGGYGPAGAEGAGASRPGGSAGAGAAEAASAGGTGGTARGAAGAGAASAGGAGGAGGAAGSGGTAGGAAGAGGAGATSFGGTAGAGGAGGANSGGTTGGATGVGGAGATSSGDTAGAGGARGAARGATGAGGAGGTGPADQSQPHLLPHSPLPAPTPYTTVTESLTEHREPETRASTPECREPETRASVLARVRRVPRPRALAVPGTHNMTLHPSSVPQRVVLLPSPLASSLPRVPDPPSDLVHAASPIVTRFLATCVTDPTFSPPAASALVAELVDFAATYRLDYLASLVSDPVHACPPSVGGELALSCDILEDRQEELECLAAAVPHLATMLLAPKGDPDALDIPTPRSCRGDLGGMWIFRVKRPPDSPPAFKARYVARGFRQREGLDIYQTFSLTPKMTILRVLLLHVAAERDYELHSLDFSTALLQGTLHEAIWLRHPQGFTRSFPEGTQCSLRRPVYGLRQAPREWHDTLRTTLAALGFTPSTADPSLFLRTDTSLPPFYIFLYVDDLISATADTDALTLVMSELHKRHTCTNLGDLRSYLGLQITGSAITLTQSHMVQQVLPRFSFQFSSPQPTPLPTGHLLSAPPLDESVEPSGPYPKLVGCLMYLMTCTRPDLAYPLSLLARYVAPSTSGMELVLGGRDSVVITGHSDASWADDSAVVTGCDAEIYAGAIAAQELCWLTYLLTDLGEWPRSPPVLYVDNKAMLALCHEQRLEHITKHIALRYFLACELQQHGQLRLSYVASLTNTADVFTKTLGSSDHQRFFTALGLLPTLPHLLVS